MVTPSQSYTGRHLPYGITQCYLPPYTSERTPPNPSRAGWYSIYLPRRDGRLSWLEVSPQPGVEPATCLSRDSSPTPNRCTTKTTILISFYLPVLIQNGDVCTAAELGLAYNDMQMSSRIYLTYIFLWPVSKPWYRVSSSSDDLEVKVKVKRSNSDVVFPAVTEADWSSIAIHDWVIQGANISNSSCVALRSGDCLLCCYFLIARIGYNYWTLDIVRQQGRKHRGSLELAKDMLVSSLVFIYRFY